MNYKPENLPESERFVADIATPVEPFERMFVTGQLTPKEFDWLLEYQIACNQGKNVVV